MQEKRHRHWAFRTFFAFVMALTIMLQCAVPIGAVSDGAPITEIKIMADTGTLQGMVYQAAVASSTDIVLTAGERIDETVIIAGEGGEPGEITLRSAGAPVVLQRVPAHRGPLLSVPAGSTLTLENIIIDGYKVSGVVATAPLVENMGTLNIKEGALLRNAAATSGTVLLPPGSVDATPIIATAISNSGTMTMTGGEVYNNTGSRSAIGNSGVLDISGGSIHHNNSIGVRNKGAFTLSKDADIHHNTDSGVDSPGSFIMTGGKIRDNTAVNGAGLLVDSYQVSTSPTVLISGGEISGNTAEYGGGIYISKNNTQEPNPEVRITGGLISGNAAEVRGGGIYTRMPLEINGAAPGAVVIEGNSANWGGGIYLGQSADHLQGGNGEDALISDTVIYDNSAVGIENPAGADVYLDVNNLLLLSGTVEIGRAAGNDGLYADYRSRTILIDDTMPLAEDSRVRVEPLSGYYSQLSLNIVHSASSRES